MNDTDSGDTPTGAPQNAPQHAPQQTPQRPAPPPSAVTVARPMIVAILYLLNFADVFFD